MAADVSGSFAKVLSLVNIISKSQSDDDLVKFIQRCREENILLQYDGSITKLVGKYIVEPVIICSDRTRSVDVIDNVLKLNIDTFCAFYAQAFKVLTNIQNINSNMAIDLLATDTGSIRSATTDKVLEYLSKEEHLGGYYRELTDPNSKYLNLGLEAKNPSFYESATTKGWSKDQSTTNSGGGAVTRTEADLKFSQGPLDKDQEYTFATIMRTFDIHLSKIQTSNNTVNIDYKNDKKEDDKKSGSKQTISTSNIVIPITIKASVIFTKFDQILNMIEPQSRSRGFFNRLEAWKSGAIKFRDLIFASDLIEKYKQNKLKDKDKLIDLIQSRDRSAASKVITSGRIGFEKYYNMLVLNSDEKEILSRTIGGDISSPNYKERLLKDARSFALTVIDPDYERVQMYFKDLKGKSDISFKALKKRKGEQADLTEVLKTMMTNNSPTF